MNKVNHSQTSSLDRWHQQVGRRKELGLVSPRPFVAFDVHLRGRWGGAVVPVDRLLFHVLHDCGGRIRFGLYGARRVPWGVALGGVESHRIERDLALEPLHWACADRLDAADGWLLRQVLRMDRRVDRHSRQCTTISRDRPALPTLWAAFSSDVAEHLEGDGPELNGLVHESGRSAERLMQENRREHDGRVLLPLAWVSHHWEAMEDVHADLRGVPRRQLFRLGDPEESLTGFRGACQYDFFASRFAAAPTALAG